MLVGGVELVLHRRLLSGPITAKPCDLGQVRCLRASVCLSVNGNAVTVMVYREVWMRESCGVAGV